jgi:hypothetical protein
LKRLRREAGLTVREAAERVGWNASGVSFIEVAERSPLVEDVGRKGCVSSSQSVAVVGERRPRGSMSLSTPNPEALADHRPKTSKGPKGLRLTS